MRIHLHAALGAAALALLGACHDRSHDDAAPVDENSTAFRPAATVVESSRYQLQHDSAPFADAQATSARSAHYMIVLGGSADELH